MQWRKSRWFW